MSPQGKASDIADLLAEHAPGLWTLARSTGSPDLKGPWGSSEGARVFLICERRPARGAVKGVEGRAHRSGCEVVGYSGAFMAPGSVPSAFSGVLQASVPDADMAPLILADAAQRCGEPHGSTNHGTVSTGLRRLGLMTVDDDLVAISVDRSTPHVVEIANRLSAAAGREVGPVSEALTLYLDDAGLAPFRAGIPMGARTALRRSKDYGMAMLAHYCEPGEAGEARREMASAFPSFADVLRDPTFAGKLDAGATLATAVGAFASAGRGPRPTSGHLRMMRRARWRDIGLQSKREILSETFELPSNWFPVDPAEALAAREIVSVCQQLRPQGCGPGDLLEGMGGRWANLLARLEAAVAPARVSDIPRLMTDASSDVGRRLLLPALARHHGFAAGPEFEVHRVGVHLGRVAGRLIYGGRRILSCVESQRAWHARGRGHAPPTPRIALGWAPLTETWTSPDGCTVTSLGDAEALRREGEDLSHCVGSYAWHCYQGECHILSIRGPDGTALSTAEVTVGHGGRLAVAQHRSTRNSEPAPQARAALSSYLDAVGEGVVALSPEAVARRPWGFAQRSPEAISAACGFDWRDDDAMARVAREFDPMLPAPLRGMDGDGWTRLLHETLGDVALGHLMEGRRPGHHRAR